VLLGEDVAQPGDRDTGLLEIRPELGHAHDGLGDAAGEHVEGDELAYRQFVLHHQVGAVPQGGCVHQLANEVDAFMGHAGQVLGFEGRGDVGGELGVPALGEAGLQGGGLDGLDAGDGFDQHGLVLCAAGEFDIQTGAQDGDYRQGEAKVQRQTDQDDEGQRHAVKQHDCNEDHREDHVQQDRHGVAGEEGADVLQLTDSGDGVADPAGLKVREGELD